MEKKTKIIALKNTRVTNPNYQPLTIEKLKTFNGMEHLSDEDLQQTLLEVKVLSAVMVDLLKTQGNSENDLNFSEAA